MAARGTSNNWKKNWWKPYGHCQKYLPHVNNLCVEMACTMIDKLETLLSIHYISNIYIEMKVECLTSEF